MLAIRPRVTSSLGTPRSLWRTLGTPLRPAARCYASQVHRRTRAVEHAAAVLLLGAMTLTILAARRLPPFHYWFDPPSTPFDRSQNPSLGPVFSLLAAARAIVPPGASVVARTNPPNPREDTDLHRIAVSLLPGRHVLPAALWGVPDPKREAQAEYLILVGPTPLDRPGRLLLRGQTGTVWQRAPR